MTEVQYNKVREDGMLAFEADKRGVDNPYDPDTEEFEAWRDGYDYAHFMTA